MKKIIGGIIGLMLTISIGVGTAYATFSTTGAVSGISIVAGNAGLGISTNGSSYYPDYGFQGSFFDKLYPGVNTFGPQFLIKNISTANVSLNLFAQLKDGDVTEYPAGSWAALKDQVKIGFDYYNGTDWITAGTATLAQWNSIGYSLEGGNLAQNGQRWYRIHVTIDPSVDNSIANKGLTNVKFTFTGTQPQP